MFLDLLLITFLASFTRHAPYKSPAIPPSAVPRPTYQNKWHGKGVNFDFCKLATSPGFTAVVKYSDPTICSLDEFSCIDSACVSLDRLCDGHRDCADGSDETACFGFSNDFPVGDTLVSRFRRQAGCRKNKWQCRDGTCISFDGKCDGVVDCPDGSDETHALCRKTFHKLSKNKWQCRDGTCISFDGKCDGVVDCPDGSDETHALCRKTFCQDNWFRCTYGACVDGTAACNGIQECADNSDELLPRCRNETDEVRGKFRCANGDSIPASGHCDGTPDCADGSDETVRACASKTCAAYLFQCAYGACVDQGSDCDGKQDCADGSDESDELCNRISPGKPTAKPPAPGNCLLPAYPDHGRYTVSGAPNASPGQGLRSAHLNFTCNTGYKVEGSSELYCVDGTWYGAVPQCVRTCRLSPHPSVDYRCQVSGTVQGTKVCNEQEPSGTVVIPTCKTPNYYYPGTLKYMRCIDGNWDHVAICTPECGRLTPEGEQLVIGGRLAERGELPWHTGIYTKLYDPYMQICGGSLVTNTVVISAAHCFWDKVNEKVQEASQFAVAAGKLYRPWNNPQDEPQKSDVTDLHVPPRFQGSSANFQDDIAVVILSTAFVYKVFVRPVCVDFDILFDKRQLSPGHLGKVAGWGLTAENSSAASPKLRVVDLPYVSVEQCLAQSPPGFREYITSDKICAGYANGTALCKGDSGGGLVFPEPDRGIDRFYLRGVVSTAPNNENFCNAFTLTSFTQITKHEDFIKQYI